MEQKGEKCGVFGIYGKGLDVSRLTFFGLYALQHRGQESSGISCADGEQIYCHKNTGLVAQVFNEEIITSLKGHLAIGHNRYSTSSDGNMENAQPIEVEDNTITLAHNGNIPNVKKLQEILKSKGKVLEGVSDSKLIAEILNCLIKEGKSLEKAVEEIFPQIIGSFSMLVMNKEKIIAVRDSYGIRPLSIAKLNGGYVFASETCAFHPIGATYIRDVLPGEMIVIDENGMKVKQIMKGNQKLDIFEFVYFSRPDSILLGQSVYEVRKRFGERLAQECLIDADVVIPVPETAIPVAIGYANATGIPFEMGLVKSRYIHRTFIEPEQHIRDQGVKLKLAPLKEVIDNKKVIIVDDSIVRGTTSKQLVKILFETGAKEVHFLVSSPPIKFTDHYGIDIPYQKHLLASDHTVEEIRDFLGCTSLNFLSFDGMVEATHIPKDKFNTSCFSGEYPIPID
jgi:amidophosphoribosyltransferase